MGSVYLRNCDYRKTTTTKPIPKKAQKEIGFPQKCSSKAVSLLA